MALLLTAVFAVYRIMASKAFITEGKNNMSAEKVNVVRISRVMTVKNNNDQPVTAFPGHIFMQLDCAISQLPFEQLDIYDFQLVKDKAAIIGTEENIGDNTKANYFFSIPITGDGTELKELNDKATDYYIRLVFQIPDSATKGYLFYWGAYWGPLDLSN